jgi:hypothetical protein
MRICPECKSEVNGATGVDHDDAPKPNDISICFECAAINKFDEELNLKPLSSLELNQIKEDDPASYDIIMEVVNRIKSRNG